MVLPLLKIQYMLVYARKNQPKHGITTVHVIKYDLPYDMFGGGGGGGGGHGITIVHVFLNI